jgi:gas vesicle protein
VIIGIGLGAAVGLLVAPQPGSETRRVIRDRVRRGADEMEDELEEGV